MRMLPIETEQWVLPRSPHGYWTTFFSAQADLAKLLPLLFGPSIRLFVIALALQFFGPGPRQTINLALSQ